MNFGTYLKESRDTGDRFKIKKPDDDKVLKIHDQIKPSLPKGTKIYIDYGKAAIIISGPYSKASVRKIIKSNGG